MTWSTRKDGFNKAKRCWRCPECFQPYMTKPDRCPCGVKFCGRGKSKLLYFPSFAESRRFMVLKGREQVGIIRHLELHPEFKLIVNGVNLGSWFADSRYYNVPKQAVIIEDVKGGETGDSELTGFKRKLAEAIYGIKVEIVVA